MLLLHLDERKQGSECVDDVLNQAKMCLLHCVASERERGSECIDNVVTHC